MLAFLRRSGMTKGFLGGSKPWMVIGGLAWGVRALQWAMRRQEQVLLHEQILPGERLVITHVAGPRPKRRRRRG